MEGDTPASTPVTPDLALLAFGGASQAGRLAILEAICSVTSIQ
jgi:hypothetical protein